MKRLYTVTPSVKVRGRGSYPRPACFNLIGRIGTWQYSPAWRIPIGAAILPQSLFRMPPGGKLRVTGKQFALNVVFQREAFQSCTPFFISLSALRAHGRMSCELSQTPSSIALTASSEIATLKVPVLIAWILGPICARASCNGCPSGQLAWPVLMAVRDLPGLSSVYSANRRKSQPYAINSPM